MHPRSIVLRYPSRWLVDVNPAHEAARLDTERWLREIGVLADESAARTFDAMNVGWYGGAPFPRAAYPELTTIARFFTLWIFHDEVLEGLGVEAPRVLAAAVRGEPERCPQDSPYVRGWWELGRRFRAAMSERWLARFSQRFLEWLASVDAEARLAAEAQRSGRPPTLEAYMAVRATNIGVRPTACWIEYALGRELDEAVLSDPDVERAEQLACRIVTFQNDVAGFDKDERRGWPNAVRSVVVDDGVSVEAAFDAIVALHDSDVAELEAACDRLARRHGEAARAWTTGLACMVAGLGKWQLHTPRYTATLPDGQGLCVRLGASPAGGTCPDTSLSTLPRRSERSELPRSLAVHAPE